MSDANLTVRGPDEQIAWVTSIPYVLAHVVVLVGAFFVPLTKTALILAIVWYFVGMFAITAGYHRYFAHRGYKTSRVFQFVLAFLGTLTSQKGVLWWAGHHRHHHRHSDDPQDIHSPKRGFWWSHHLWILCRKYDETPVGNIRDFAKYPEIRFLNRTWMLWPVVGAVVVGLTMGLEVMFWSGFATTIVLWHCTFTINSLAHVFGSRRYETTDTSRNNFWLALLTLGEGWHNNHHHYQSTARNGFFWWEVDISYYVLKVLSWFGVVWDLRQPPQWVLEGHSRAPEVSKPARAFSLPASLVSTFESLSKLEAEPSPDAEPMVTTATRVAERASDWAERALEAAQQAERAAADFKEKLHSAALEGGQRAAEIAEAAAAAAERFQSQSLEAARAARKAADRAAQAVLEIRRLEPVAA